MNEIGLQIMAIQIQQHQLAEMQKQTKALQCIASSLEKFSAAITPNEATSIQVNFGTPVPK